MAAFAWNNILSEMVREITPTVKGLVTSYVNKDKNTDTVTWMSGEMGKLLPDVPSEDAAQMGQDIADAIGRFSDNMRAIHESCAAGHTREEWLRVTLAKNAEGMNPQEYASYLEQVNENLAVGNKVAQKAMENPEAEIHISEEALAEIEPAKNAEWNRYRLQALSAGITEQAELAGMNGLSVPVDPALLDSMEDMADVLLPEMMEDNASSDLDSGVKMAAAAALKVVAETKKIPFLSKLLPIAGVTNLACWAVEGAKCLGRCALGNMSAMQGIEHMKRASVAVMADLITGGLAPKLFAAIPVIGMPLSFAVSVVLPNMAAHEIREKLYTGITKICETAKTIAKTIAEKVTGIFASVKNMVAAIIA